MSSKYNMIEFRVWRSSILARNSVRASSERNTDVCLTINHSSQVVRAKPCKVSSVQLALTEQFPIPDTRSNFCEVNHSRTHAWGEPPLIKNLVKIQIFVHFPFWKINHRGWDVLWSQTDNKSIHKTTFSGGSIGLSNPPAIYFQKERGTWHQVLIFCYCAPGNESNRHFVT